MTVLAATADIDRDECGDDPVERSLRLVVAPEIADRYPACRTAAILVRGLRNGEPWPEIDAALSALESEVRSGARQLPEQDDPAIVAWHELLRSFGTNPRRLRPSVDALSRRLAKAGRLPRISPLVDAGNLISLRYTLPTGGYDLSRIREGFTLRFARPGDVHIPLGKPDEREQPVDGEVVYADGAQVLTRHWNHRDADNTKVTAGTVDAILLLEGIVPTTPPETLARAQRELADLVAPHARAVELSAFDPRAVVEISWKPSV